MSGVFEAYPAELRTAIERMRNLPRMAYALGRDFRSDEQTYTAWPGWTDDYAQQNRPVYERNNEFCTGSSEKLFEALDGLVQATLANLNSIERTQSDSEERIAEHRRRTPESIFDDGETGGSGGGRR
ncbi:hypothetical protein [Streptomyces sp. NPDC047097]|uniref:hypothetical protein n=1 Tax=Streptomyces sp. NPDC047097 TaxID=3155260 RepID=UPI0033CF67BE